MQQPEFKYSVNTNRFTDLNYREIVDLCSRVGADGIEWGLRGLDDAKKAAREMSGTTRDAGLEVMGFINAGGLWKTDEMREWSEAVKDAGGGTLRVAHPFFGGSYEQTLHQPESFLDLLKRTRAGLERLVPLGEEYGIRYVLELHSGSVVASPAYARQVMDGLDSRWVGAIYDPANCVVEGFVRPRAAVEILGEYLAYLHAKNVFFRYSGSYVKGAVRRAAWERCYCPLECGMVDFVEVFFALKVGGVAGWISLEEFFGDKDDPEEEIRRGILFLKECAQAAPSEPQQPYDTLND